MRLIDADAFLADLKEYHDYIMQDPEVGKPMKWRESVCFGNTVNVLVKQPTIEAAPVVHGRWIELPSMAPEYACSECGQTYEWWEVNEAHFCPNCGAKMDGEKDG